MLGDHRTKAVVLSDNLRNVLVDIARDTNEVIRITIKVVPSEKMFMMSDPVP